MSIAKKKPTKDFSTKQEKMIADYLNWKTVPASGARDFHPGDIVSQDWIGECKTHVDEQEKIIFYREHWLKLQEEAFHAFRYPALFVDNGSQVVKKTWVLYDLTLVEPLDYITVEFDTIHSGVNLSFEEFDIRKKYQKATEDVDPGTYVIIKDLLGGQEVGIVPLTVFKEMFGTR